MVHMKKCMLALLLVMVCSVGYSDSADDLYTIWYERGIEQVKQGDLEEARLCFSAALSHKPDDANATKALAMAEELLEEKPAISTASVRQTNVVPVATPVERAQRVAEPQKDFSVRVALGSAPGIDEGELLGVTFPVDADHGGQLELLVVKRFWNRNNPNIGGVFGGGVFFANNSGTDVGSPDTFELKAFGIMGQGGVVAKLGQYIVVEAVPYLGLGGAHTEITGFSDGGATYAMYGIKGGVFVLLGQSVELGLEAGYHGFTSEVELDFGGPTADLTLSGNGARVAGVLAIKF
jgi:hypothetical protein